MNRAVSIHSPRHFLVQVFWPLVLCVACGALPTRTFASWPNNPAVNIPVSTAAGSEAAARACSDGAGGIIEVWEDNRGGALSSIFAQRVSASGDLLWSPGGDEVSVPSGNHLNPVILSDGSGGAYIAWVATIGTGPHETYLQRLGADGTPPPGWPAGGIVVSDPFADASPNRPALVEDGAGGVYVAWSDASLGLAVTRYDGSATLASGWTAGGNATGLFGQVPVGISDGAGGLILAFMVFGATDWDISALRVLEDASIAPGWPAGGVPLSAVAGANEWLPAIVSDGAGGAIVAWELRPTSGPRDIYAGRVTATGAIPLGWFPGVGVPVCVAALSQYYLSIAEDGSGGAFIGWYDNRGGTVAPADFYVQHLNSAGLAVAGWPVDGLGVSVGASTDLYPAVASDGEGGVYAAWTDSVPGANDIRLLRLTGSGTVSTGWPATGRIVSAAPNSQYLPSIVVDAGSGAIVYWFDLRDAAGEDLYAQRVSAFGQLGNPEPAIASVEDVPNDEGGFVKLSWEASELDRAPAFEVASYRILRSVPPQVALAALSSGARLLASDREESTDTSLRHFLRTSAGGTDYYWELLATQSSLQVSRYSYVAATTSDSTPASNPETAFMIQARNAAGTQWWFSQPDSGYSVDNLAPSAPSGFAAHFHPATSQGLSASAAAFVSLHWMPNREADFAEYRIYRGPNAAFDPDESNFVAATSDTGYVDTIDQPGYYKLAAVDIHGNARTTAAFAPAGPTGVEGTAGVELALAAPAPNPATSTVSLRLFLPEPGHVSLAVYDAAGRLTCEVLSGPLAAGEHARNWDLRDASGRRVASGRYFLRLRALGRALTRSLALTP